MSNLTSSASFRIAVSLIATLLAVHALAQGTLATYASFNYLYQQNDPETGALDFVNDIWINNEMNLITVNFTSSDTPDSRVLAGITATVYEKNGASASYSTTDVPPIVNPYDDPTGGEYKHWWGVIGFAGFTKKELVFAMWDYDGVKNQQLLVSYTLNKRTRTLNRNNSIAIPTVNEGGVTTKFRRVWPAKNYLYYVVSSTNNATGATTGATICAYDMKLVKRKKLLNSPNPGDLAYGDRGGNSSMLPMPAGFLFDDYTITNETGDQVTRHVHVYRQP